MCKKCNVHPTKNKKVIIVARQTLITFTCGNHKIDDIEPFESAKFYFPSANSFRDIRIKIKSVF